MLETIREFARESLTASDEEGVIRGRHAEFFRNKAEEAETELTGEGRLQWLTSSSLNTTTSELRWTGRRKQMTH